jgi:tripartite ATP-independent transporter DctM subunit
MVMEPEMLSILLLLGVLLLAVIGAPVAFSLASLGIVFGLIGIGPTALPLFVNRIYMTMNNLELPAIPLFIFMGFMLESCGIAGKLYDSLHGLLGRIRGGLAVGTIIISTLFAACTGVIAASIVTMGTIALPSMIQKGYSKELATGSVVVGGTLGVIIPPSIVLILYGTVSGLSVAKIFTAAMIPGIFLSILYVIYVLILCWFKPHHGPVLTHEETTALDLKKVIGDIWIYAGPTLGLIFFIIGSISFGIVAITEAAALGAFGSIVLAAFFGKLSWSNFKKASLVTLKSSCMVLFIIIGASMMSVVLIRLGGADLLGTFVSDVPSFIPSAVSDWYVIGMIMIVLFFMGMFIDWIGILYIAIPAFTPVILSLGFDPLWFAIIVNTNLQMAFCTPPFALSLFFLKGVAPPGVTMLDIYRGILPFIGIQALGLIFVIIFQNLSLWLPGLLF